jgi:hypothetical protein
MGRRLVSDNVGFGLPKRMSEVKFHRLAIPRSKCSIPASNTRISASYDSFYFVSILGSNGDVVVVPVRATSRNLGKKELLTSCITAHQKRRIVLLTHEVLLKDFYDTSIAEIAADQVGAD